MTSRTRKSSANNPTAIFCAKRRENDMMT